MTEAAKRTDPDHVLRLVREYPHPPARVFAAWTDPAQLVQWWGPQGVTIPYCEMDVRPDGAWATTMRNPDGSEHHVDGRYLEIDAPHRLSFTWAWTFDGERGHETVVTVTFNATDSGTELVMVQEVFESEEMRDLHGQGWNSSFDCLASYLS